MSIMSDLIVAYPHIHKDIKVTVKKPFTLSLILSAEIFVSPLFDIEAFAAKIAKVD
jgi:hypothetical protein